MKERLERILLRPTEAFEAIGIGKSTGYAMIAAGELPFIKLGKRSVRIPVELLRRWVAERLADQAEQKSALKVTKTSGAE